MANDHPVTVYTNYRDIATKKQQDRDDAINDVVLSIEQARALRPPIHPQQPIPDDREYISADAAQIVKNIETGRWTATSVLQAYILQSAKAQGAVNCLTESVYSTTIVLVNSSNGEWYQSSFQGCA